MPSELRTPAFILGAVLLLVALLGGGFEIFGVKIGQTALGRRARLSSGVLGLIFIILSFIPQGLIASPPSLTSSAACPNAGATDDQTIRLLIQSEADAANSASQNRVASLEHIRQIFTPNATIRDAKNNRVYNDPIAYYTTLYQNYTFQGVRHSNVTPVEPGIVNDSAVYTGTSEGSFAGLGTPTMAPFGNPPPSERWLLHKQPNGCWSIIEFTFNL